jgi:hypothetical protein
MTYLVGPGGAVVRAGESKDAEALARLAAGARFDVLDVAGSWAWGEVMGGKAPVVGYVLLTEIAAAGA